MVLALAGCGGDDSDDEAGPDDAPSSNGTSEPEPDSDEPSEVDVCALLTAADLEAAFGGPWDGGEFTHQEQTGGDQCVWGNTDPPPVKVFSVTVLREGHLSANFEAGGVTVAGLHEDTKELTPDAEDVDGLGDDAFLAGTTLTVLDGDTSYSFSTLTGDSPEAIAGMQTLAEQIVG
jgi:hypothetical protein